MSVLAGGVFVAATWAAARLAGDTCCGASSSPWRCWRAGASLLWFGHVENYSWATALAFATVVLAVGHWQGRVRRCGQSA